MDSITKPVSDKIESRINDNMDDINANAGISIQELREIRGPFNIDIDGMTPEFAEMKVNALKIQSDKFKELSKKPGIDTLKSKVYETAAETAELKADQIRLRVLNQQPETDEVMSMIEEESVNNDMNRFEKFKRWVRSNFTTLSLTLITVGGVVTSIVMGLRNAASGAANALKKAAKSTYNKETT